MKEQEHDILQSKDLKKMPYTVPDGYFESLKAEARKTTEPQYVPVITWTRIAPYAAIAAMFLFIFALGKFFINEKAIDPGSEVGLIASTSDMEDYLVFNPALTDISMYYIEEDEDIEYVSADNDDIMEYLIYIGASEEYIEYNKQQ